MRRAAWVVCACACTPAADTVGAWTDAIGAGSSGSTTATTTSAVTETTSSSSSSSSGADTSTSSGSSSSTTGEPSGPVAWVATVVAGAPPQLRVLDVESGQAIDVCALAGVDAPDGLAFLPDDRLVGTVATTTAIWIADPCDCTITPVVGLEPPLALHAIAERHELAPAIVGADGSRGALFGVHVDVPDILALGELVIADAITALAAESDGDELLALAVTDGVHLLRIDAATGTITADLPAALPEHATGLTLAPDGAALLACDDTGALWRVDPQDAGVALLDIVLPDPCRTLATPHGSVACIDALFEG